MTHLYKSNIKLTGLNQSQLDQLKKQLLIDKKDYEKRILDNEHYGLKESERDMSGELSTSDNHPADIGTAVFERGKDVALNEHAEQHFEEVNRALESMNSGEYGLCIVCDDMIPFERLEAVPATQYCKNHAPDTQKLVNRERPVEEEFLTPPFGRTSLDERDDQTQFDGEDAWQIVESWGTSDTPAMAENPDVQSDYDHMFIEADEADGYVEPLESFLATDIHGHHPTVVKNREYYKYMASDEGDHELEVRHDD